MGSQGSTTSWQGRVERFTTQLFPVLLIGIVVSYCNDTFGPEGRPPANLATRLNSNSVEITTPELFFLELNGYEEIRAIIRDAAGTEVEGEITWSSRSPNVVRAPTRCGGRAGMEYPCARSVREGLAELVASYTESSITVSDTTRVRVRVARRIRQAGNRNPTYFFRQPGGRFRIEVEVLDGRNAVIEGAPVSWESSVPEVAAVDSTGVVDLLGYGSTLITARAGRARLSIYVDVISPVTEVRIDPDSMTLSNIGDVGYMTLLGKALYGGDEIPLDGVWSSTNDSVAGVRRGAVTAVAGGEARIIAHYDEDEETTFADTAYVLVREVERIEIQPRNLQLPQIGSTARLRAEGYGRTGKRLPEVAVVWSSSDPLRVSVDSTGTVEARAYGTAKIHAEAGTVRDSIDVRVGTTEGIFIEGRNRETDAIFYRYAGGRNIPRLVKRHRDHSRVRLTVTEWSTADTTIARVEEGNLVRGLREGETTLYTEHEGTTYSIPVRVEDPERHALIEFLEALDPASQARLREGGWGTEQLIFEFPGWNGIVPWLILEENQITPPVPEPTQASRITNFHASLDVKEHALQRLNSYPDSLAIRSLRGPMLDVLDSHDSKAFVDSLQRENEGRVFSLQLPDQGLEGKLPDGFLGEISAAWAIDISANELTGSLEGLEEMGAVSTLALHANGFTGDLPPNSSPVLFLFSANGNRLDGTMGELSNSLFGLVVSSNELTGEFSILEKAALLQANWADNAGLCVADDSTALVDYLNANRAVFGPICGREVGVASNVVGQFRNAPEFSAAGDSVEFEFTLTDHHGIRLPDDWDSIVIRILDTQPLPGGEDSVVVVRTYPRIPVGNEKPRYFLHSRWSGFARLELTIDPAVSGIPYSNQLAATSPVVVNQVVDSLQFSTITGTANSFGTWELQAYDRNDSIAPILPDARLGVTSSDASVVTPHRRGFLEFGNAGSATLTATYENEVATTTPVVVAAASATDTGHVAIDSIRPTEFAPGAPVSVHGSRLEKANRVYVDGAPAGEALQLRLTQCFWFPAYYGGTACGDRFQGPTRAQWDAACTYFVANNPFALSPAPTAADCVRWLGPYVGADPTTITSISDTLLTFTAPSEGFSCLPPRSVPVAIMHYADPQDGSSTLIGASEEVTLAPSAEGFARATPGLAGGTDALQPRSNLGEHLICAKIATESDEEYLVTLTGSVDPSQLDNLRRDHLGATWGVTLSANTGTEGPSFAGAEAEPARGGPDLFQERDYWLDHRQAEIDIREQERALVSAPRPGLAASRLPPAIDSTTQVGDQVTLTHSIRGICENVDDTVTGTVRVVNNSVVIVSDNDNRTGFTQTDLEGFARLLDQRIMPLLIDYFGEFPDVNGDGRVTILFTDDVGAASSGLLGWVTVGDAVKPDVCATSNEMEIFYGRTPDERFGRDKLLQEIIPPLIAHELTHIIQLRPAVADTTIGINEAAFRWGMVDGPFRLEGQATLAEEVVGLQILDLDIGTDLRYTDMSAEQQSWFDGQVDVFRYLLPRPEFRQGSSGSAPCSWITSDPSPCRSRPLWYGVGSLFLRYINDQFFGTWAQEKAFHKRLIDSGTDGPVSFWNFIETEFATNPAAASKDVDSVEDLLSGFTAMFFLDSHPDYPSSNLALYQTTTWDMYDLISRSQAAVSPTIIPNTTMELGRVLKVGSGLRFLVRGALENRNLGFEVGWEDMGLAELGVVLPPPPLTWPMRVIRIK